MCLRCVDAMRRCGNTTAHKSEARRGVSQYIFCVITPHIEKYCLTQNTMNKNKTVLYSKV